ncbi:MAG: mechanosensitive ion channel family protein [Halanaerobiales bacterium]|nr:mechanosensitive ion channel family protein [Halanaerobiales bacterium]
MDNLFNYINNILFRDLLISDFSNFLSKIINTLVVIIIYYLLWKIIKIMLNKVFKKINTEKTLINFLLNMVIGILTVFALITISLIFGMKTSSILASLGVFGLAIGLAAQDFLTNIISGLFIFWDKPFVIDDLIEINDNYGQVVKITMRTTKVVTQDGKLLTIPNKTVVNNIVASYTNFPNLRIAINFTVDVNEDIDKIRNVLFKLVEDENEFLTNPKPEVVLDSINDYNIELIFRVWIKNEKKHVATTFDIREKVLAVLINENINMPYETLEVKLNS